MEILWGHAIRTSLTLIALVATYFWAVKPLQVDILRQRLFAIRDDLFDFAADEGIGFDHPAYRGLRDEINSFIRFAHKITFSRLVLTELFWKMEPVHPSWHETVGELSPLARTRIIQTYQATGEAIVQHFIYYSPIVLAIYGVVILRTIWEQNVHQRLMRLADSVEQQAREDSQLAA
jgi:hypothetical protein